jgi:uncharacterized protein YlxW (UPF0749 family)
VNKGHRFMMFLIFLLLGILITLQFRGIVDNASDGASVKDLALHLEEEKAEGKELLETLAILEAERDQLLMNIGESQNNPELKALIEKRDYEYLRAGLTTVSGDGITITMQDAQVGDDVDYMDYTDYIIHDADINAILNELRINGAEAISINGERIIGTSRLVCAGPTIFLNVSRYPPPYVIKAIGDPDILFEALDQMINVAVMRFYGITVDITKEYGMVIEKYRLYQTIDQLLSGLEVVAQ